MDGVYEISFYGKKYQSIQISLRTFAYPHVRKCSEKKEYIFWNIEDYLKLSLRSSIVLTFVSYQMALSPLINVN